MKIPGFYMKQQCLVTSPENQNHACSTTISKDKSENDIYANQTKCVGTFGVVFLKYLLHFRAQNPQKLLFLLRHIYGQHCKIRHKMARLLEKIVIVPSAKDRQTMCINENCQNIVIT